MLKYTLEAVTHLNLLVSLVAQDGREDVTSFTGTKGLELHNVHHFVFTFASTLCKLWCHSDNCIIARFFSIY